jgi:hypothetical protein
MQYENPKPIFATAIVADIISKHWQYHGILINLDIKRILIVIERRYNIQT